MEVKIIHCVGCDGFSDPAHPKCRDRCPSTPPLFPLSDDTDVVVYQNKTFSKIHYRKTDEFVIIPFFVDVILAPVFGKTLKRYEVKDATVRILKTKDQIQPLYRLDIPDLNQKFETLFSLYAQYEQKDLTNQMLDTWIKKYGILDYLLADPHIQEININPPEFQTPMRIIHEEFDECTTNIYPTRDFLNYLATVLKIRTGRPLNKSQPQLDGEIMVEKRKARVAAIREPFSIFGTGYSIRVHREKPWTLPLFMENNAINDWFAGLMGLAITHGRTFMIAGPRGSGKTALLGALMLEILPKYRIITIEDTQELPIEAYQSLGYDLISLKVKSALVSESLEMPYDKGLRTSLRLGDSVLIVGEIRSKEAAVLYEAMRVGAMSNVVAGTVHADNPYGVYDRVVNDLDVPRGSFKATDLIVIVKQIKTPSTLKRVRRVTQVTEVLKDWETEPKFQDLLVYNPKTDTLEPTKELLDGKSIFIQQILEVTRGYRDYQNVLDDLKLRAWAKKRLLDELGKEKKLLEAPTVLRANVQYAQLFNDMLPLESKQNEEKFKQSFEKILQAFKITE
ncbi:MAG: type II/IV secretion system ATPase subunit [Candidatus Diapherotrites archaeon]|nr:type II/IV secretion system ATPase subunit [Candidatus Diapherotrites archaeon]